jgi:ribosomal protein S18 acetylase RimI-like enzyme
VSGRPQEPADIAIRPAEATDIDALLAIENSVFPTDRLERRNFRHAIRSPTIICLVAAGPDDALGYVIVERRRNSAAARLTSIAVTPKAAGAGLGRRLLGAAENAASAADSQRMRLEVRADNRAARRLYEATGYRLVETLDAYYEDGAAALRYEKALARP